MAEPRGTKKKKKKAGGKGIFAIETIALLMGPPAPTSPAVFRGGEKNAGIGGRAKKEELGEEKAALAFWEIILWNKQKEKGEAASRKALGRKPA